MAASPEGRRLVERRWLAMLRDRYPGFSWSLAPDGEEGGSSLEDDVEPEAAQ